ncbi:MAG: LLM class flavin-dependent oxidoreductase [Gammaproteobacteria bacterium]
MKFQLAAFCRTTLPLDIGQFAALDDGRYHSLWFPDHYVSFWPDSIWTPEFTDLATVSKSPHRYVETFSVIGAAAALTRRVGLVTTVTDTIRRHPALLAQTALTLGHLSRGRFVLGIGCGERENAVPYGLPFDRPVGRFEEALEVIRLLFRAEGPVDYHGRFFQLEHARMDTEPFEGRPPPIWIGASGPRMLELTGRIADGWLPTNIGSPEEYAGKLSVIRAAAERAGRDPDAIVPTCFLLCLIGDDAEISEILRAPLVKSYIFQVSAQELRRHGHAHPCGENWRGFIDLDPHAMTRERLQQVIAQTPEELLRKLIMHGTPRQVAAQLKPYADAGVRVARMLDYSGMAGLKFAAAAPAKMRATEDALLTLVGS